MTILPYELPFSKPIETAQSSQSTRKGWWIILQSAEGYFGLGDCAPWIGFGLGPQSVNRQLIAFQDQCQSLQGNLHSFGGLNNLLEFLTHSTHSHSKIRVQINTALDLFKSHFNLLTIKSNKC